MNKVEIGEYKCHAVISLPLEEDGDRKFTFGLAKARVIVKYFDDILKFAEREVNKRNKQESSEVKE